MSTFTRVTVAALCTISVGCADDEVSDSTVSTVSTSSAPATDSATTTAVGATPQPSSAPSTAATTTAPLAEGDVGLTPYVEGFSNPVDIAWRAGDPAIYIVEQSGVIKPVIDGNVGEQVLNVSDLVSFGGEQGLLGLAFDPEQPLAFINYTDRTGDTVIAEYAVGADGVFDEASRRTVITVAQPYGNHNGGDIAFGPDGLLYIGMGDGGGGGDSERHALALDDPLGKMLRIDPHFAGGHAYTVPVDNPFVTVDGARPEIWSVGLRNPWRFNFDSATGDLWIADVGQGDWEEVDVARAADGGGRGVNFGWSAFEGTHRYNGDQAPDGATPPIYEYSHGDGGCSISGGTVYRGDAIAPLHGWYVFGDYCSGNVVALNGVLGASPTVVTLGNVGSVSAISDGPDGELYILAYNSGAVLRIDAA
ncbi:MAG: PQQ-dependent sugar dehydrogenase [Actinobacteria bacterium]|nr:PQQ-dependent sugar dehydrogenase [Actinomycetota bacterium]